MADSDKEDGEGDGEQTEVVAPRLASCLPGFFGCSTITTVIRITIMMRTDCRGPRSVGRKHGGAEGECARARTERCRSTLLLN